MYSRKILNICLTLVIILPAFGVSAVLGAPTVLYDDFDDNDITDWDIAPTRIPAGFLSEVYDPALPDVHDGRIWGKGSGYSPPLYTGAVKDVTFDASGSLVVEFVGRSGPSWPNQAVLYLMTPSWPDRGEVYAGAGQFNGKIVGAPPEGYMFNIYGESNKRVQLARYYFVGGEHTKQWLIQWSYNDVYNDHTYRFERDSAGNWKLYYGDADGSNMQLAPIAPVNDMTHTSFGYVFAEMFRNQSCFDYIQIEAERKITFDDLYAYIQSLDLGKGIETSLLAKVSGAKTRVEEGKEDAAVKLLQAFCQHVQALWPNKISDSSTVESLVEYAQLLINELQQSKGSSTLVPNILAVGVEHALHKGLQQFLTKGVAVFGSYLTGFLLADELVLVGAGSDLVYHEVLSESIDPDSVKTLQVFGVPSQATETGWIQVSLRRSNPADQIKVVLESPTGSLFSTISCLGQQCSFTDVVVVSNPEEGEWKANAESGEVNDGAFEVTIEVIQ